MCKMKYAILKALQLRYKVDNRFMISHEYVAAARQHSLSFWCTLSLSSARAVCRRACVCVSVRLLVQFCFFFALQPPTHWGLFLRYIHPLFAAQPLPLAGTGLGFWHACVRVLNCACIRRPCACVHAYLCVYLYIYMYICKYVCVYVHPVVYCPPVSMCWFLWPGITNVPLPPSPVCSNLHIDTHMHTHTYTHSARVVVVIVVIVPTCENTKM